LSLCSSARPALTPTKTAVRPFSQLRWLLAAVLALCSAAICHAQFVDASAAGEPVQLTGLWRFHEGDDAAWASPGFDDSNWTLMPADKQMPQPGNGAHPGSAWYRIRVKLPATREPLALAMGATVCEVYADGRLVGTVGFPGLGPKFQATDNVNVIPLPPDLNGRTVTLAVRVQFWYLFRRWLFVPSVAPARLQWQQREADSNKTLLQDAPHLFSDVLSLCLGMFSLGLFLLQRRSTEYGWAALSYLVNPVNGVSGEYLVYHHARENYAGSLSDVLQAVFLFATAMFIWRFIGARRGWLFRVAMVVTAIFLTTALLEANYVLGDLLGNGTLGFLVGNVTCAVLVQGIVVLFLVRMGISAVRGNRNAQLLCIPLTLSNSLGLVDLVTWTLSTAGMIKPWDFTALQVGQVTITWMAIFNWLSFASMGLVLVLRFARSAEREQRLSTEMETARRVQAQLVPAELPGTEHFRFEAVYKAASEVGGDLYQVYPRVDGSVMVLVGDVSGHGLKAAMLGTLLVGASNALAKENLTPAQMLARLNDSLYGHTDGGFATCLCCLVAPDGRLNISNAGHLAPYRNGQEVPCASGLPLGLLGAAEYDGTELQLGEGDTLTFLSDGVVEARNAQGELFGFARAQAISAEPAQKIAEQAIAFGQEDDISVLRLTLEPTLVRAQPHRLVPGRVAPGNFTPRPSQIRT
jgi:phosphoserine phosphatase RsbU/P